MMAGDWIKIRTDLADDPSVYYLSDILGIDCPTVVGHLVIFWSWMDKHTQDGDVENLTCGMINKRIGLHGFAESLKKIGWLEGEDFALYIPNFDRHNGNSAKARALECEAKRIRRVENQTLTQQTYKNDDDIGNECPTTVGQKHIEMSDQRREEKRREEIDTHYVRISGSALASDNGLGKQNQICDPDQPEKPREQKNYTDGEYELAARMAKPVQKKFPRMKIKLDKWAEDVGKLVRLDGRTSDEITQVWRGVIYDDFWSIQIRTPGKLRKRDKQGLMYFDLIMHKIKFTPGATHAKPAKDTRSFAERQRDDARTCLANLAREQGFEPTSDGTCNDAFRDIQ